MSQELRSWLPVGLALGATLILASLVAATCSWRAPSARRGTAVASSPRAASMADADPEAIADAAPEATDATGDRRTKSTTPGPPTALPSAPRVPAAQDQADESAASDQEAQALGQGEALDVPWARRGQCPGRDERRTEARAAYLASFVPLSAWHTTLFFHPSVPRETATTVAGSVEKIHGFATDQIGLPSEPPPIYLYPNVDVLREHSCAAANAVAYYDGAIHLAVTEPASDHELHVSLRHEYAHHVLVSNGVGKPIWFQEGTAMAFAGDAPPDSYRIWREHPVDLSAMVDSFPTPATPETANVFNVQALEMNTFLVRLCLRRSNCNPAQLARALISGSATPATLFAWATADRASDLVETTPLELWADYERRGNFGPEVLDKLLERGGLRRQKH